MGLICGWFHPSGTAEPDAVLGVMASVRHGLTLDAEFGAASPMFGLRVMGDPADIAFARDGDLWAALVGPARFTDPDLARIAGHGAAVALIEAYRRHGPALLDRVAGHFTLVVADTGRRAGLAAIDRAGVGRLCFAEPRPGTVVFATSADAVTRFPGVGAAVDDQAIFDFLSFFAVPCPSTIYRGVRKLRPAERLILGAPAAEARSFWHMPYDGVGRGTPAALAEELRAVLAMATRRACAAEPPARLGAYLSGGLDSSTVAGLLAAETGGHARTFTVGFAEPRFDERPFARIAADHFATAHTEIVLTADDAVALLPRLAEAYDEPFANTSAIPAFYCAQRARTDGVGTLLAGDGGDELFAGNSRYLDMIRAERHHGLVACLAPLVAVLPVGRIATARKARDRLRRLALPLPERMHSGPLDGLARVDTILSPGFLATVDRRHPAAIMTEVYERTPSRDLVQRMMHHDLQLTLADNDLRKVVRTAELAGVRVRFPMLDDEVMAFSARVPPSLLMAGGNLRAFYKQAMSGFLPDATLTKKKQGFGMPFGLWARTHPGYFAFCADHVRAFDRRGILAPGVAEALLPDARSGTPARLAPGLAIDVALLESWLARRGL